MPIQSMPSQLGEALLRVAQPGELEGFPADSVLARPGSGWRRGFR